MGEPVEPESQDHLRAFKPQVTRPPRTRVAFFIAFATTAVAGGATIAYRISQREPVQPVIVTFERTHCTPLEVEQTIRDSSLSELDRASCLAVAGKIDRARGMIAAMSAPEQQRAASAIFSIAHPIADAGDDTSAGPIMALVCELQPNNYMAVFHAGMAEFALGHDGSADHYLRHFLDLYAAQDVWRGRAERALADIAAHAPLDRREAHFPE